MQTFYRKFFHGAAGVLLLAPLTDALKGPGKSLVWSPALDSAFHYAKDLLASVSELIILALTPPFLFPWICRIHMLVLSCSSWVLCLQGCFWIFPHRAWQVPRGERASAFCLPAED